MSKNNTAAIEIRKYNPEITKLTIANILPVLSLLSSFFSDKIADTRPTTIAISVMTEKITESELPTATERAVPITNEIKPRTIANVAIFQNGTSDNLTDLMNF